MDAGGKWTSARAKEAEALTAFYQDLQVYNSVRLERFAVSKWLTNNSFEVSGSATIGNGPSVPDAVKGKTAPFKYTVTVTPDGLAVSQVQADTEAAVKVQQ